MENRDYFALFIHHGGYFAEVEGIHCYMKGNYVGRFDYEVATFDLQKLHEAVKSVGYSSWTNLCYRAPKSNDFRVIETEIELKNMLNPLTKGHRIVSVYVEGGVDDKTGTLQTNLSSDAIPSEEGDEHRVEDEVFENEGDAEEEAENHLEEGRVYEVDDGLEDYELDEGDEEYIEARQRARETKMEELQRLVTEYVPPDIDDVEEQQSEYETSDGDVKSDDTDEDEDFCRSKINRVVYDPKCDHKELQIVLGMRFQDGWQCKSALTTYSIENGKFIQFRRVSKDKCEARCIPPCQWRVYASAVTEDQPFCLKTYRGDHTCPRAMNNKLLTSKWVAMKYLNVFRVRPDFSIPDLRSDIVRRWKYDLPKDRLYKAKAIAKELVRGTVEHHYGQIRRYLAELRRVDREGRFELLLGDNAVFKGLYMGFSSLIKGFKRSCRPLIGLDGCFLKTYLGGILLCAIGKDGNDQMFPIAWAVVEIENEENWSWFLKCLIEDIGICDGNGYAFISDQQKIRCSLMVRQVKKMDTISKVKDTICPNIRKKIERLRASCGNCVVHPGFMVRPPVILKKVGRPKKKRVRAATKKDQQNPNKLRKTGMKMTCKKCGGVGHNKRGCKNDIVELPTKEKGKVGRQAKPKQATTNTLTSKEKNRRTPQETEAATAARERNFARRGVGVFIAEGTGNIYTHAPFQRRVYHVNRAIGSRDATTTTNQGASSTQESINASENAPRD